MNYCTNCGRKLIENASFCGACGKTVEEKVENKPKKEKQEPKVVYVEEKKLEPLIPTNAILTALFAIVLTSILLIFCISAVTKNKGENTLISTNDRISLRF